MFVFFALVVGALSSLSGCGTMIDGAGFAASAVNSREALRGDDDDGQKKPIKKKVRRPAERDLTTAKIK
ncbi:MAG: hypothetical protein WCJ51_04765 [Candidatus Moraniibacteriota bacterium]